MAHLINGSDYCITNCDSPTKFPSNAEPCSQMSHQHQRPSTPHALGRLCQRLVQTIYQSSLNYRSAWKLCQPKLGHIQIRSRGRPEKAFHPKEMRRYFIQVYSSRITPHPHWTTQTPRGTCTKRYTGRDDQTRWHPQKRPHPT